MIFNNIFMETNYISIFIFILLILLALFVSEFIDKINKNHEEITRKIAHILIGILFTLSPLFMEKNEIIISSIIYFLEYG
ncbi:hypothetical protein LDC_1325 [sediment metagenome]|uniref:Uncharacterized protein n=1 Tax=sediment metagenome TaxID=749907 RepID=D9PIG7_9ZZZZ